ncbi:conserved hypothetical protein [Sporisorium reilianum SRZ2]|uniref:Uncharacterized protein n=1 Tax=Sporisorium reilianum (strain SRZ2) TaxID=999809 RepID=E7A205_SPORE|nr:conserved hypothetical protein [Sporisorium reilianum SRZ2]
MPPKRLSISRIRAESSVRSHDPDLNRASKRYRSVATSSKRKRAPQPRVSARILRIHDDDIEETKVQNRFAPDVRAQRQNVSFRSLTPTQLARRDGDGFEVASLAGMCCEVVAGCFDSLLPSREIFDAAAEAGQGASTSSAKKPIRNSHTLQKSTRKRSKARAFGAAPDSDDDQHDYVPSDDDAPALARSTRSRREASSSKAGTGSTHLLAGWTTSELHYLTRKTSEQLKLLSPAASFLLYKTLVEQAPQHLTKPVISSFFLPPVLGSSSAATTTAAKTHVWLPASIPLLAHDKSAASFLVGHLTLSITAAREHRAPSALSERVAEDVPLALLPARGLALVPPVAVALRSLQLHGLTRLQDSTLARLFEAAMPSHQQAVLRLDTVSLRGCIAVADRTVSALCRATGPTLRYLNLDYTDITAASVATIKTLAPELHTLKLGYNDRLSDKTLQHALQAPATGDVLPFAKLANLRLRKCGAVGEVGVACFLRYAHATLEVLDVSHTLVGAARPDLRFLVLAFPAGVTALRKLNMHGAAWDYDSMAELIERSPRMHTLMVDQTPGANGPHDAERLLARLVASERDGGWSGRTWNRLHVRTMEPSSFVQRLLPDLLAVFPQRLQMGPLDSPFLDKTLEYDIPANCKVQHLGMRGARLGEHLWRFLPQLTTLRTLDLGYSDVPATIEANAFLESIDLSNCKQMRISTRRNAFALVARQSSADDADKQE